MFKKSKHKNAPKGGLRLAFSLVELMISLIVVSVVAATFVPVITKKLSSSSIFAGSAGMNIIKSDCEDFNKNGGTCHTCFGNACINCEFDNCNGYLNVGKCQCESCASRSDNCIKCNSKSCTLCNSGFYLDNSSKCVSCPNGKYCDGTSTQKDCSSLINGCYSCSDNTTCKQCKEGFYLNGNICAACPAGYYCADGKTKQECDNKTYSTGSASSCSSVTNDNNCSTFSKTEDKCEICKNGYILNGNKCELDTYYKLVYGLYVTKYNMGDYKDTQIASAANVTVVNTGVSCTGSRCCWTGATSSTACDNSNGSYSGCNRTVCTLSAAKAICANYKQDGRTWRLPTSGEMGNWVDYSIGLKNNGLMLCDAAKNVNSAYCFPAAVCRGGNDNKCYTNEIWSATSGSNKVSSGFFSHQSIGLFYYLSLLNGAFTFASHDDVLQNSNTFLGGKYAEYGDRTALSVRCVSDSIANCATYSADNKCTLCNKNYYVKSGKCYAVTKRSGCTTYSPTEDKCIECEDAYTLSGGKCTFDCKGKYYLKIGNLCVMKKNFGNFSTDAVSLYAKTYGATEKSIGSDDHSCGSSSDYSSKCCWYGDTADDNSTSENGGYSGKREVCNWAAANAICSQIKEGGKTWRLPTTSEMSNWGSNSISKGSDGLMLCDGTRNNSSSAYCYGTSSCTGAYGSNCWPAHVWSGATSSSSQAYKYYLQDGSWRNGGADYRTRAISVRCVALM